MDTIQDFEDILFLLARHRVRYLIVGGLAFIFHAKPRYTKDIDIWVDNQTDNIVKANKALTEFGSPYLLSLPVKSNEILQLGVAPDRIDILLSITGLSFDATWPKRIVSKYGQVDANWIDIDSLIEAKSRIDSPRHQDDVNVLLKVKEKLK
jgi:hypothetical protein